MPATGYNVVDIAAAKEKGIPVSNVPTYGTAAVGQFAIAMLLEICHHVALHCPLFPETEGVINKAAIAKMKDGVILPNNSRGPLIVEQDVADALKNPVLRERKAGITGFLPPPIHKASYYAWF